MNRITQLIMTVLLIVSLSLSLCSCVNKESKNSKADVSTSSTTDNSEKIKTTKPVNYGMKNIQAMIDYAQRLEKEGNEDAATQVWALIPKAAEKAAKEQAKQDIENRDDMKILGQIHEATELADDLGGGK
ncbi:MAG: hypothetical protein IJU04_06925 [Ruminococcus sp.]|nr:hypothetical protein [Ruminococcus sp.]